MRGNWHLLLIATALACLSGLALAAFVAALVAAVPFLAFAASWIGFPELQQFADREHMEAALAGWIGKEWLVSFLLDGLGLRRGSLARLAALAFIAGFAAATPPALWRLTFAKKIHDRLFRPLDTALVQPLRAAQPFDPLFGSPDDAPAMPPMLWADPIDGRRKELWDSLGAFARSKPDSTPFPDDALPGWDALPFRYTVIMGPAGSGKSRFALEFARAMAQRKRLGDSTRNPSPPGRLSRLGIWWRLQVCGGPGRPDDPWDAGLLTPQANEGDNWGARLEAWRPRRPTMLLLDDPLAERARGVAETLHKSRKGFRHPVRLLVINQTAPQDLGLGRDPQTHAWVSELTFKPAAPLVIDDACRLTPADLRRVSGSGAQPARLMTLRQNSETQQFLAITQGLPLLVELGLQWLRDGRELSQMTQDKLLTLRAQRIVRAMERTGFEVSDVQAVAIATLSRGATIAQIDEHFRVRLLPADLRKVFPAESLDDNSVPPVRPEMVGDAFLLHVFNAMADISDDSAQRMVDAAWTINPAATLRTALRLGGGDRRLGRLLINPRRVPHLAALDLVLAYADVAMRLPRADWELGRRAAGRGFVPTATGLIEGLGPADASAAVDKLIAMAESDGRDFVVRGAAAAQIIIAAMIRACDGDPGWSYEGILERLARFVEAIRICGVDPDLDYDDRLLEKLSGVIANAIAREGSEGPTPQAFAHAMALLPLSQSTPVELRGRLLQAVTWASCTGAPRHALISVMAEAAVYALAGRNAEAFQFASSGATAIDATLDEPECSLMKARLGVLLALGRGRSDLEGCREAVNAVEAGVVAFAKQRDFILARAQAWSHLAAAQNDAAVCREAVDAVEAVIVGFAHEREIALECARVWCCLAMAFRDDAIACKDAVYGVEAAAADFAHERDFALECAQAWQQLAFTRDNDAAARMEAVASVEKAVADFAHERDFALELTGAWLGFASIYRDDAVACKDAVKALEAAAADFAHEREFSLRRVQAWRHLAFVCKNDAMACKGAVSALQTITADFMTEREFALERVQASRFLAFAHRYDAVECKNAIDALQAASADFSSERNFVLELTRARSCLVCALQMDADGCKDAVENLEKAAADFVDDPDFARELAQAWGAAAFAGRNDASAFKHAIERLECIERSMRGAPHHDLVADELDHARAFRPDNGSTAPPAPWQ